MLNNYGNDDTWDKTVFDNIVPSDLTIATPVSSHDDSIPSTINELGFDITVGNPDNVCLSRTYLLLLLAYPFAIPNPSRIFPPLYNLQDDRNDWIELRRPSGIASIDTDNITKNIKIIIACTHTASNDNDDEGND